MSFSNSATPIYPKNSLTLYAKKILLASESNALPERPRSCNIPLGDEKKSTGTSHRTQLLQPKRPPEDSLFREKELEPAAMKNRDERTVVDREGTGNSRRQLATREAFSEEVATLPSTAGPAN